MSKSRYISSSSASSSSPENCHLYDDDEDEFLDSLIENIDLFYDETMKFMNGNESNESVLPPEKKRRKRRRIELIHNDDNTDDADNTLNLKRKVSKSHSKYIPVLLHRIVNADIRKKFSFMFANVINSYDSNLLHSFFNRFTTPDIQYTKLLHNSTIHIHGNKLLADYFIATLLLSPDKVIRVNDTKIIQRSDSTETELFSEFILDFTKLYNYQPNTLIESLRILHELSLSPPLVTKENIHQTVLQTVMDRTTPTTSSIRSLDQPPPQSWQLLFPRLEHSTNMHVTGTITFTLNTEKKINKIFWNCVECKEL